MSGGRGTTFTRRSSSLPFSFILFFPSGIGCWSSGRTRLWKQWWWEVFLWQVCLLKTDSIILGGALPGPVCWAHPSPTALTHAASFCEPGKCHCDRNWRLGGTRLKGHWILSPFLINRDVGWGMVFTCKIYKDTWVSQEDLSSVLRIHVKKSRAWWHAACSC